MASGAATVVTHRIALTDADGSARCAFVPDRVLFEQRHVPLARRENRGRDDCVDCLGMWMDKNAIKAGILKEHIGQ